MDAGSDSTTSTRRRSSRVVKAPTKFQPTNSAAASTASPASSASAASKRKRGQSASDDEEDDSEADEEEARANGNKAVLPDDDDEELSEVEDPGEGMAEDDDDDDEEEEGEENGEEQEVDEADDDGHDAEENDDHEEDEEEEEEEESDDEEIDDVEADPDAGPASSRSKRKKKPSSSQAKAKSSAPKPAAKRARTGETNAFSSLPSRPKKSAKLKLDKAGNTPLYIDIFGSGLASTLVAERWLGRYREAADAAVTELVNCVLECAGCDLQVTEDDIRDTENYENRLADLQSTFQDQHISEYPLISRAKGTRSFRELLISFFDSLVTLMHETDLLYGEQPLMASIINWVVPMSSSTLRPFRHTATTIALAIQSGLVVVADVLDKRVTSVQTQLLSARRSKNKAKIAEVERTLDEAEHSRTVGKDLIEDNIKTVFVHRYRDVDPKIRTECVEALGGWIMKNPTLFMGPEYLRYLGWLLSDVASAVRLEVLKQLTRIIKRDGQQLGHFIDRFRPRLLEMARLDVEASVRVAALGTVDLLRADGMLEAEEVDAVGRLIFDNDPRIRRAVVPFFVACVDDLAEAKAEEFGGDDVLEEVFGDYDEREFDVPRREWLRIKCLAENLATYDAQIQEGEEEEEEAVDGLLGSSLVATSQLQTPETRISLASQILYDKIVEFRNWEILAGYLLYDHTTSTRSKSSGHQKGQRSRNSKQTVEDRVKAALAPEGLEETVLLEILAASTKLSLAQPYETEKLKRKPTKEQTASVVEGIVFRLANIIRRLLNKFGGEAGPAAAVLRLEHSIDLDIIQQLQQETSAYEKLLDEIAVQFVRHDDRPVLGEAMAAFLRAQKQEELAEVVESKLSSVWDNVTEALRNAAKNCDLSLRGNLGHVPLAQLATILHKLALLATTTDCTEIFESTGSNAAESPALIQLVIHAVQRGVYSMVYGDRTALEDEAAVAASRCAHSYFMWKTLRICTALQQKNKASLAAANLDALVGWHRSYWKGLVETFSSRTFSDEVQLSSAGHFCDLFVLFRALHPYVHNDREEAWLDSATLVRLKTLSAPVEPKLVNELIFVFEAAEKTFAKKSRKTLNEPAEDEEPIDDDEDDDENAGQHDLATLSKIARMTAELHAEQALCSLTGKYVLAIATKALDCEGPQAGKLKRRLLRNQAQLGLNFKEVVALLDEEKMSELIAATAAQTGGKKRNKATAAAKANGSAKANGFSNGVVARGKAFKTPHLVGDDDDEDEALSPVPDDIDIDEEEEDDDEEDEDEAAVEEATTNQRQAHEMDDDVEDEEEAPEESVLGD